MGRAKAETCAVIAKLVIYPWQPKDPQSEWIVAREQTPQKPVFRGPDRTAAVRWACDWARRQRGIVQIDLRA